MNYSTWMQTGVSAGERSLERGCFEMQAVFIPPRFCCSKNPNDYPDHQHIYTQPFSVLYSIYYTISRRALKERVTGV